MWKTIISVEIQTRIDVNNSVDNLLFLSTGLFKNPQPETN